MRGGKESISGKRYAWADIMWSKHKRLPQLKDFSLISVTCDHVCEKLSWILTDVKKPRFCGSSVLMKVSLGCRRKSDKQETKSKPASRISSQFLIVSCLWLPSLAYCDLELLARNTLLSNLLSIILFITEKEYQARTAGVLTSVVKHTLLFQRAQI